MNSDHTYNYSELFFFFRFEEYEVCEHRFLDHALLHAYSGRLMIETYGQRIQLEEKESVFIRKGTHARITSLESENPSRIAMLRFPDNFLREFYFTTDKTEFSRSDPEKHFFPLRPQEDLDSLFGSMLPYYGTIMQPIGKVLKLKIIEGIYALLRIGDVFYSLLFGFAREGKTDIFDLLAEPYVLPFHRYRVDKTTLEPYNKLN